MEHYDLVIIGSGSGNAIPEHLADRWNIAVVERGVFGGTCLNVGCIPSKMFVLPADVARIAERGPAVGVHTRFDGADWVAIRDRVFGRIDPIADGGRHYRAEGSPNISLVEGTARFTAERTLDIDGRRVTADRVLVAVGARPVIPDIPGLATVRHHTSDTIMRLEKQPDRLAIIGGGFIAAEMGHVFSAFGTRVSVYNRSKGLLRDHDRDVARRFTELFGQRVDLHLGTLPTLVEQRGDVLIVHSEKGEEEVDEILVAAGRTPNSDLVDAEAGGLTVLPDGRIEVDETLATTVENVWAIGDVANAFQLKHLANKEASIAFWNMAHPDEPRTCPVDILPYAVFSEPQVAAVGLTEQEAEAEGIDHVVGHRDYAGTAYGWALEDTESFAKVIIERTSKQVLGAHIIGPQASTLIQPLVQAMTFKTPADELARTVLYIHPALTEVVENALLDALDQL
jgi:mycothione reductase